MQGQRLITRKDFAIQSTKLMEAQGWMQEINGPHSLAVKNQKSLNFKHSGTEVGHIATGFIRYSTEATVIARDLTQSYCIGLPLVGKQWIKIGNEQFTSDPSVGVILSPNVSFQMTMAEDCEKRMVRISRFAIEECLRQLLLKELDQPVVFQSQMNLDGEVGAWLTLYNQLLPLLSSPDSLLNGNVLWRPLEQALVKSLLYTQPHNYSEQLLDQRQLPAYLQSLEAQLHDEVMEPLRLQDIEKKAGVSRDRLYRDFQRYYQSSPMAYFKNLKLEAIRQRLLVASPDTKVSSVALDYGFNQLGRFSQEYKARFKELPSDTLNGLKG